MSGMNSVRRKIIAALRPRAEALEAALGLILVGAGAAMFSLGAALILVGAVIFALAVWGRRIT